MRKGWTETTLGEVVRITNGNTPSTKITSYWGGETPWITTTELTKFDGKSVSTSARTLTVAGLAEGGAKEVRPGTTLLGTTATIGTTAITESRLCFNQQISGLTPKNKTLLDQFLFVWARGSAEKFEALAAGTSFRRISTSNLRTISVSLPPLVEQRRIVDVIESVDTYINALETRAATARTARSALLHELLSAGATHWPSIPFGQLLEIERGSSPRPISAFLTDREDGTNWIKIGDASASTKYIYSTARKITLEGFATPRFVKPGDFILSNSMSFGRPYIMRTHGCIHDGWMLLSEVDRNFDEDFLYNLLQSNQLQEKFVSLAAGSGVRNLKIDSVKSIEVQLPPKEDQLEIAATMNSFDKLALSLETSLADARDLRSALLSDLLSGDHEIPESYDRFLGAA